MSIKTIHVVSSISNESMGPSYSVANLCRSLDECGDSTTLATLESPDGSSGSSHPFILRIGKASNKKIERAAACLEGFEM
jgi:hypothetical protein